MTKHSAPGKDADGLTCVCPECMDARRNARREAVFAAHGFSDKPITHRLLPQRMLAAVEDRVRLMQRPGNAKHRARAAEAAEILGILRNVVRAYEDTGSPI